MSALHPLLRDLPEPDPGAQDRAWRLVDAAYARRSRTRRRGFGRRLPAAALGVAAGLVLALTPAGADVAHLVRRQVAEHPRTPPPRPAALARLPGGGKLLVATATGLYTAGAGHGVRRIAGRTDDAAWSAFGRYVVTARGREVAVSAADGRRVWRVVAPGPADGVRWSPDGNRIAYLSARTLRVVAGDGTGDRLVAGVAAGTAAPAWRPGHGHQVVYAATRRVGVLVDVDSGRPLWRVRLPARTRQLAWSADGRRLLALGARGLRSFDSRGRTVHRGTSAPGRLHVAASPAPSSHEFVLLDRAGSQERVSLVSPARRGPSLRERPLLTAAGIGAVHFSPDGGWILVDWRGRGSWLLVPLQSHRATRSVDRVPSRFGNGEPIVAGWCCHR